MRLFFFLFENILIITRVTLELNFFGVICAALVLWLGWLLAFEGLLSVG